MGEDKTIQNTFNAFWGMRYGKNAQPIDWKTMIALCKAAESVELRYAMKDIMDAMRPFIDKQGWEDADWISMIDVVHSVSKKYNHDRAILKVLWEVADYVDRREAQHQPSNDA